MKRRLAIAIHGGAGVFPRACFPEALQKRYLRSLAACLDRGYQVLAKGGSALDAVERAVRALEDAALFNAGRGSVLNQLGRIEMDASIMSGDARAGAVAAVRGFKNPIALARAVHEDDRVVLLCGKGAEKYGAARNITQKPESYFVTKQRQGELRDAKAQNRTALDRGQFGTVGAVARDRDGRLASATSTGGLTNKLPGRVSDSALIGAGTFAKDATCAVSCTGVGEVFIREAAGHAISARMEHGGMSLAEAAADVVHDVLMPAGGAGGIIAVSAEGRVVLEHNCPSMYRAWRVGAGKPHARIFSGRR